MTVHRYVPNSITVMRILCAPLFLWLLLDDNGQGGLKRWLATFIFVAAIATDGVDGYLARKHDRVTNTGKLLDPIADKVLTGSAFVGLSILGELPWWITIVVLVREVGITIYRLFVAGDHVLAAAWMGKAKTVAQGIALGFALAPLPALLGSWMNWVNIVLMTIAVGLTIASGIDFVVTEVRARRAGGRTKSDAADTPPRA